MTVSSTFHGGVRQPAHAEVVDDEERRGGKIGEIRFACVIERRVGEFLHERVRLRDR